MPGWPKLNAFSPARRALTPISRGAVVLRRERLRVGLGCLRDLRQAVQGRQDDVRSCLVLLLCFAYAGSHLVRLPVLFAASRLVAIVLGSEA